MQVSHLITRGILLVVGRVTERGYGVLGVIGGSRGDQRWSKGVCLTLFCTFCPSESLVRHQINHIIVQLSNIMQVRPH